MNTWFRRTLFAGAALAVLGLAAQAYADDPPLTTTPVGGNPTCTEALRDHCGDLPASISELTVQAADLASDGLFTDGTLRVDIDDFASTRMDWTDVSSGGPIDVGTMAVIVKAGKAANVSCHVSHLGLLHDDVTGPPKGGGGSKLFDISHVTWCYPTTDRTCPLENDARLAICAVLPAEATYFFCEAEGPSILGDSPCICNCSASIFEECNPDLPAGTVVPAGALDPCGTGDPFQGFDSIDLVTSGTDTCDTVCRTIGGRRRCFNVCF